MSPTAGNIGAFTSSDVGTVKLVDNRGLTIIYMDLYVAERPRSTRGSRLAFALEPMPIYSITLKIIGQMKRTKFLVDVIQPVKEHEREPSRNVLQYLNDLCCWWRRWRKGDGLPPLSRYEAKELVAKVQEYIDYYLVEWARKNPEERTRVCVNITPDLLDAEILST